MIHTRNGKLEPYLSRGFRMVYHEGFVNHCPSCSGTNWIIGRLSAECGFCATALPLADTGMNGAGVRRERHYPVDLDDAA